MGSGEEATLKRFQRQRYWFLWLVVLPWLGLCGLDMLGLFGALKLKWLPGAIVLFLPWWLLVDYQTSRCPDCGHAQWWDRVSFRADLKHCARCGAKLRK